MRLIQVISDFIRRSILTNDDDMVIRSGGVPTRIPLSDVRDHAPNAHASSHEKGGSDEINVTGLSGTLADPQTPSSHASTHGAGGSDEINVNGLSGQLADEQKSSWALVSGKPSTYPPSAHATSHKPGGSDELSTVGGIENSVARVIYPGGGTAFISGADPGAVQIKLPSNAQTMYDCMVFVYNWGTGTSFMIHAGGYVATADLSWKYPSVNLIGTNPPSDTVRFCHNSDGSEWYIVIGETSTVWNYSAWRIVEVANVYGADINYIKSGWEITKITTLPPNIDYTFHATAGNASYLEGHPASYFLPADGKAVDSDKLDGYDSTYFLPADGKAADSDKLDGHDSTYFLEASRPAFRARLTGSAIDVTGDGTWFDMSTTTWSEDYDINNNFNNGVFTAPVNGIYSFGGVLALVDITTDMTAIILDYVLNSTNYFLISVSASVNDPGSVLFALPFSFDVQLTANDTIKLKVLVDGGTKVVNVEPDDTFFYGHLIEKT